MKNNKPVKDATEQAEPRQERIEDREITTELKESYINYAMSVIVSRALPDARDGLKPVQRRIIWSMWESGLKHSAKLRKSANVVGGVMAHYHPHGDSSIYDAIARMVQDFSLRYPLVQGQGNWGSIDGDAPAAMRYSECRLSKISEEMATDIEKETVDWEANYDNTKLEPKFMPAKLPNLLLNGAVGIAVGMATSIPPHNLAEVADAIIYLNKNKDADVKNLMKFIPGPDFPTGGIIYDSKAIEEAYITGKGVVTMRALAQIEEKKSGSFNIVITEIPYQVNKSTLLEKIAELVQDKKIEGIKDMRDESDRDGLRIFIELKNDAIPQKILNQLYQYTELQKNFHFNMLALVDGIQPQILSLKETLVIYLTHRKAVVERRTRFDLKKAEERAHILEGLKKALDSIDEVISTIKKSKDKEDAAINLIKKFKLTPIQTQAILEMRLQALAALERKKIEDELREKTSLIKELRIILKSPEKIADIVTAELEELKKTFSDPRRTKIIHSGLTEFREEDLVPNEETVIMFTLGGYIKRLPPTNFRAQRRGGKGLIGFDLKEEDFIDRLISANTHDNILFFTDKGKVFQTKVYEIPAASRTAKGKSIHNYLEIPQNESVSAIIAYPEDKTPHSPRFLVMATKNGVIKKTPIEDFASVRRTGIIALTLKKDDLLRWVKISSGKDEIAMSTSNGQAIRFKEKDVRQMGRSASGVKGISLKKGDFVAGLDIIKSGTEAKNVQLLAVMKRGFAKRTPISEYKTQKRGGSGIKTAKVTEKTGAVISTHVIDDSIEEILAFSKKGQAIRTSMGDVRIAGRATQGVHIMNLDKDDELIGVVCL
ncbi:MAG: gyrase subunit A protein [Candidatus Jorgensenbacteria bacterium GW2011_GWA2_45_9]|uniref:DNA gyrase subunit A n=1 Tax=Candidatus Jorgensenbacteria bacterium GW2011_GWA2_45_9 TaxID=1618663 RepID=A0A0G1QD12_9BACT|nr:MAG: gyrase subunit A protein [Candidatus Jorgensenbacteria bacterium GW2011_GWA2_45_9]